MHFCETLYLGGRIQKETSVIIARKTAAALRSALQWAGTIAETFIGMVAAVIFVLALIGVTGGAILALVFAGVLAGVIFVLTEAWRGGVRLANNG